MTDGKAPHYLIDLDLDRVAYFGIGNKDHKSFYLGNAIAFPSNVLNINIVLFSNFYWCSSGATIPMEGPSWPLNKSSPSFAKTIRLLFAVSFLVIRLLNSFAPARPIYFC